MSIRFLADENVDDLTIDTLRNNGFPVTSIKSDYRGLDDKNIISLARKLEAVIITQDKDFGEWIFSFQEKSTGVILLRYIYPDLMKINSNLLNLVKKTRESLSNKFIVITRNKIRIRKIV